MFYALVDHLMTNENRPSFIMTDSQSPVESTTYGGKLELEISPTSKTRIYMGIDANLIGRKGDRTRVVKVMNGIVLPIPKEFVDKIWQDANLNSLGLFAETKYKLSNHLTTTAGLRADFIETSIKKPAEDFEALYGGTIPTKNETNISGNVSFKYQKNGFQTQLALGRGIRTASMIERYINHFNVGVDAYEYVGNPNLKPEVNHQIELSFIKKFQTIEIGGNVFHSFLKDYISAKVNPNIPRKFIPTLPPLVTKQFINLKKATQTGIEFSFQFKASKNLSFGSEFSYTYAQNKDFDEPLSQIPPFMANLNAKYETKKFWVAANTRLVGKQDRVSTVFMEQETPGFGTTDIRIGFEPFKRSSFGVAMLNIFDKKYYEHLNYSFSNSNDLSGKIYEPGRNFTAYMKYSF